MHAFVMGISSKTNVIPWVHKENVDLDIDPRLNGRKVWLEMHLKKV